jgi:hypothetical protein
MGRSARTIGLLAAGMVVLAAGCSSAPWSATRPAAGVARAAEATAKPTTATPAAVAKSEADSRAQAMQEVMAELQQLRALDPAAQETLMADLRQTDPELWPLVLQQFRAAMAYRRRAQQQEMAAAGAGGGAANGFGATGAAGAYAGQPGLVQSSMPTPAASAGGMPPDGLRTAAAAREGMSPDRLPTAENAALPPTSAPEGYYPATGYPAVGAQRAELPGAGTAAGQQAGRIVGASYDPAAAGDWRGNVESAIRALESQSGGTAGTQEDIARQAELRMLYLLAGEREKALLPIAGVPPATEEFWSKQLYGLDTWLDGRGRPDAASRAAEAKRILGEALARLGETAPLEVRNLAFCSKIQSYGCVQRFKEYQFTPGQEVLLYAEIENFTSEATAKGWHTSLRSSYQIYDGRGQAVAEHDFGSTEEYCENTRRDFFMPYRLRLPTRIYPGKYSLKLTVEDVQSKKVGQSSIEFTIANP